jgi:hypothetical protein
MAAAFVCSSLLAAGVAQAGQKALLIAAGAYPHLPPNAQLSGPARDIQKFRQFLISHWGFQPQDIMVLKDQTATKKNILGAISKRLPQASQSGDRVVIYYSGHGSQIPDKNGDEKDGKDETLVPTDYGKKGGKDNEMVSDDELAIALKALKGRKVVVISDSCHSGTVTRGLPRPEAFIEGAKKRYYPFTPSLPDEETQSQQGASKQIVVGLDKEEPLNDLSHITMTISAAMPNQLAWESGGEGIFTHHFIQAMSGLKADFNRNGRLTSNELINYIKPRTEEWCKKAKACREQNLGFTPNIDPKKESFVLMPPNAVAQGESVTAETSDDIGDIIPQFDTGALDLSILPGNRHKVGDVVKFRITSKRAGYLTLLDHNAAGDLVLLFPSFMDSESGKKGKIRAGAALTVPDPSYGIEFEASEPRGKGRLIALVTEDPIDFSDLIEANNEFEPIADKDKFLKDLASRLYEVWTGESDHNRGAKWILGMQDYVID